MRRHLESAARRGHQRAIEQLEGPEFPDALAYLHDWLYELHGRSGVGMNGLAPLSYATIAAWSALTGNVPNTLEVRALFVLDASLLSPPDEKESSDG